MKIIPGETRLIDYLYYLDAHCDPDEMIFKDGFHQWTCAALLRAPPPPLDRGLITDRWVGEGVENLCVMARSLFARTERHLSIYWSSNRHGWAEVAGQTHYFVNRKLIKDSPVGRDVVLMSLCRRMFFENHGPFLEVDGTTSVCCEDCRAEMEQVVRRGVCREAPTEAMASLAAP